MNVIKHTQRVVLYPALLQTAVSTAATSVLENQQELLLLTLICAWGKLFYIVLLHMWGVQLVISRT